LFFITLKEWGQRKAPEEKYNAILAHLNREFSKRPEGVAFAFSPPAIPGIGTAGGVTFVLQDRAGRDVPYLAEHANKFMAAARERPEIASIITTFNPAVPQVFVTVDRDKVLKQGVALNDVYKTLQAFMGGAFINYFNRFGRQWQVYVQAEGEFRTTTENMGQFYVRNSDGAPVPLSAVTNTESRRARNSPCVQSLSLGAVQRHGNPGYSSAQIMKALEETFDQAMPPEMGYAYKDMSFQEKQAQQGISPMAIFGLSLLFVFLILAAQYESWSLPFSVLLGTPVAVAGAFVGLMLGNFENNVYAQIGL
jgi:HAE1 family hydrophobic/amphiphilic exporter-1